MTKTAQRYTMIIALVNLVCLAPLATAGTGNHDDKAHRMGNRRVWVYTPAAKPARVITKSTGAYADRSDLIKVRVVDTTVYLDADADYIRGEENPISANHYIPAAQRLYRSLNAKPARIVQNSRAGESYDMPVMQPRMIFLKPEHLRRQRPDAGKKKRIQIPSVPAPPKKDARLMAMSQ